MGGHYADNRAFADSYEETLREIVQNNVGAIAAVEVSGRVADMRAGADFRIIMRSGRDVLSRVRRDVRYRDFTIRAFAGGSRTELDKLRDGYGGWYVYAWTDESGTICDWILVDLDHLRDSGELDKDRPVKRNRDGRTGFISIPIEDLRRADAVAAEMRPANAKLSPYCEYGKHKWSDVVEGGRRKKTCSRCQRFFGYYATPDSKTFPDEWIQG